MGQRGPAPKPTPLRVLHGDRKDRINTSEPKPASVVVECPTWLPPTAKTVWSRLGPDLAKKEVLTFWDVDLFARFCWFSAQSMKLMKQVDKEGLIVKGDKGVRVKNPAMQLIRDMTAEMRAIGAKFGLTPSDRTNLSMGDPDADPSDSYFT